MLGVNGDTVTYDAESRQVTAVEPPSLGGATETYSYDGGGQRVEKSGPSGTTVYVYDALGQLAAEYSTVAAVQPPCKTCYLSYDHLGSVRLVTDQNAGVISRHDFLPFGEEIVGVAGRSGAPWGAADNVNQKFTGQERDAETGLDFFQARYYGSALGRFTSPDTGNAGVDLTIRRVGTGTRMWGIIRWRL
jgi:RHS repeat-associated protein